MCLGIYQLRQTETIKTGGQVRVREGDRPQACEQTFLLKASLYILSQLAETLEVCLAKPLPLRSVCPPREPGICSLGIN